MSTELTISDLPLMRDSLSLDLYHAAVLFQRRLGNVLVSRLGEMGYADIAPHHLEFLAQLECGITHASELARQIGVSRQAIHKQVKPLVEAGYLKESKDLNRSNRNTIGFSARGLRLMADCRSVLAEMDRTLNANLGEGIASALPRKLADAI